MAQWDARLFTPTARAGLIHGRLVQGPDEARLVVPGDPERSELLRRIAVRGPGQMPPIATTVVDAEAVALIERWIREELPSWQSFEDWQRSQFPDPTDPVAAPEADPDRDGDPNYVEYLAGSAPWDSRSRWVFWIDSQDAGSLRLVVWQPANRAVTVEATADLTPPVQWSPVPTPVDWGSFPAQGRWLELPLSPAGEGAYYRLALQEP